MIDEIEVGRQRLVETWGRSRKAKEVIAVEPNESDVGDSEQPWQVEGIVVVRAMDPGTFERRCQRLLRQAGFTTWLPPDVRVMVVSTVSGSAGCRWYGRIGSGSGLPRRDDRSWRQGPAHYDR